MLSAPAAAAVPPPTPPVPRYVSMEEIDKEDNEDALAPQALIDNAPMTPEDACLFINPDYVAPAPVTGGGGKGNQMLPMPKNKALDNASRATESGSNGGGQAPVPNVFMVETAFFLAMGCRLALRVMGISLCTWSLWGWFFSTSWTAFRAVRTSAS
jgi:hypothetical protein